MNDYGECVITRLDDPVLGVQFRIDRADPVIRIDLGLLGQVPAPAEPAPGEPGWPATFDGKILRIRGVNQTVVYRIRDILESVPGCPGYWSYIGEWPD